MKTGLTKALIVLAVVTVLASVALTFAQPYYSMKEEANAEDHEECEELMEHMHRECAETVNERHHNHQNTQTHNETTGSNSHHGCH